MIREPKLTLDEQRTIEQVRDIKGFYFHLITYVLVISLLFILNILGSSNYIGVVWAAFGWGIGLIVHGVSTFEVFKFLGTEWEKNK